MDRVCYWQVLPEMHWLGSICAFLEFLYELVGNKNSFWVFALWSYHIFSHSEDVGQEWSIAGIHRWQILLCLQWSSLTLSPLPHCPRAPTQCPNNLDMQASKINETYLLIIISEFTYLIIYCQIGWWKLLSSFTSLSVLQQVILNNQLGLNSRCFGKSYKVT